ncbi:MAG: cytochrome c [Gemmatimonadota bacterium]
MPRALRWIGYGLGGMLGALAIAAFACFFIGRARLTRPYDPPPGLSAVPTDSIALARGAHLLQIYGCQECHGRNLSGQVYLDLPLGKIVAPNLTRGRGGVGSTFRVEDWDHAIRFGVRPDHVPLLPVMPFRLFNHLSDQDAGDLIAYLRGAPPVDHELPATTIRMPGYILITFADMHRFNGDRSVPPAVGPPPGTAEQGAYLAATICVDCHGDHLQGGKHPAPDAPPGPTLAAAAYWPLPAFATALRTGMAPGNRRLNEWMPAFRLQYLSDEEIQALYAYLQSLKPGTS